MYPQNVLNTDNLIAAFNGHSNIELEMNERSWRSYSCSSCLSRMWDYGALWIERCQLTGYGTGRADPKLFPLGKYTDSSSLCCFSHTPLSLSSLLSSQFLVSFYNCEWNSRIIFLLLQYFNLSCKIHMCWYFGICQW